MLFRTLKIVLIFIFVTSAGVFTHGILACNVPVFRYALERWLADEYRVFVFYRGELSVPDREVVAWLENSSKKAIPHSNFTVQTVDVAVPLSGPVKGIWEHLEQQELPSVAVMYPGSIGMVLPLWVGELSSQNARALTDSPVRQEIARRILDGESVVWILLESGNREKDNKAAAVLEAGVKECEQKMVLPDPADYGSGEFVPIRETGPKLRIAFSMIRLSRKDPRESLLVEMLMKSEPDLTDYTSYPMAFPVFGRGRVLFALVGDGIENRNIFDACSFLIGPCSCQVKELNPGVDLLMMTDWDAGLNGYMVQDTGLPPLVGLSELARDAAARRISEKNAGETGSSEISSDETSSGQDSTALVAANIHAAQPDLTTTDKNVPVTGTAPGQPLSEASPDGSSDRLLRNIFIALAFIAVVTLILSMKVLRPHKKDFL